MTNFRSNNVGVQGRSTGHRLAVALAVTVLVAGVGCAALSPAFLNVVSGGTVTTIDNAPGHVVIAFVNNATVSDQLVSWLESADGGGLILTPAELANLRPIIRLRMAVQFTDQSVHFFEFISGSREFVQPEFQDQVQGDISSPDLTDAVVVCDVALVQWVEELEIEVFVPVAVPAYEFVEPTDNFPGFYQITAGDFRPTWRVLQPDTVQANGSVLNANYSVREQPAPVNSPLCGSVVTITVTGELSVPFSNIVVAGGGPSYAVEDVGAEASIGGRYGFAVSVR